MTRTLIPLRRLEGAPEEMSDEALLAACATGATAALGALFDRYSDRVYRFLASRAGTNDDDVDDLVQQTFEIIGRSAGGFNRRSAAATWIFGVANNVARHYVRSEVRRKRLIRAVSDEPRSTAAGGGAALARKALRDAIATLPDKQREAFVLVYLEGMSGRDAAAAIGCREGTVWKRLHQARARLREQLGGIGR